MPYFNDIHKELCAEEDEIIRRKATMKTEQECREYLNEQLKARKKVIDKPIFDALNLGKITVLKWILGDDDKAREE
jgi:hypothetical protein